MNTLTSRALRAGLLLLAAACADRQLPLAPAISAADEAAVPSLARSPNSSSAAAATPPDPCTNAALTPFVGPVRTQAGYTSVTHYHQADTPVRVAILRRACVLRDQPSGRSVMTASLDYTGQRTATTVWLTDMASGDGRRWRNALNAYLDWTYKTGPRASLNDIKGTMRAMLVSGLTLGGQSVSSNTGWVVALADQMVRVADAKGQQGRVSLLAGGDDQGTLDFMDVQAQCLEAANQIAIAAGGKPRSYSWIASHPEKRVTDKAKLRPGMGLFFPGTPHATIIVDLEFNAAGTVVAAVVGEANWPIAGELSWSNPSGQRPWERRFHIGRRVPLGTLSSSVYGVDFE